MLEEKSSSESSLTLTFTAAIERLTKALEQLEKEPDLPSEEIILEILLARDGTEETLSQKHHVDRETINQLFTLDEHLKNQAKAIATCPKLNTWRESLHPPESAWWWFLEAPKEVDPWDLLDPLWNSLTAAFLGLTASFMFSILQVLSSGGLNWTEAFGTLAQGAGLAWISREALTQENESNNLNRLFLNLGIPKRFHSEVMMGVTAVFCGVIYLFHSQFLPNIFRQLGENYYKAGELADAKENYQNAIKLTGDDRKMRIKLGEVYESLGDLDQAIEQYKEAIDSGDPDALNHLGRTYIALASNQTDLKNYITTTDLLQTTNQINPKPLLLQAESLLRLGLQRAESQKGIPLEVKYQLHRNLGWVLLKQKQYPEAEQHLKEAIDFNNQIRSEEPGGHLAECLLTEVYKIKKDQRNLEKFLQDCLKLSRPETIYEYQWLLEVGQRQIADCINTKAIVGGLNDQNPQEFNPLCQKKVIESK